MIIRGHSSTVWLSKRRGEITRFGCGRRREGVEKNYAFLDKFSDQVAIPKPLGKYAVAGCVVARESRLPGEMCEAKEFVFEREKYEALRAMSAIYRNSLVVKRVNWGEQIHLYDELVAMAPGRARQVYGVIQAQLERELMSSPDTEMAASWIHGDMTFRNMVFDDGKIGLFDFDRSEMSYPEFDILHLYYDWLTHRDGPVKFQTFIKLQLEQLGEAAKVEEIVKPVYELLPEFKRNKSCSAEITGVFVVRSLACAIEDCVMRRAQLEWLDEVASIIRT